MEEIIEFYLPEGLPTEDEIRKMTDQKEIDELYQKQNEIISQFRKFAISELAGLDLEIKRSILKLTKLPEERKVESEEKNEKATKRITKTPTKTPSKAQASIAKTPRSSMKYCPTPVKKIKSNKERYQKVDGLLSKLSSLVE